MRPAAKFNKPTLILRRWYIKSELHHTDSLYSNIDSPDNNTAILEWKRNDHDMNAESVDSQTGIVEDHT